MSITFTWLLFLGFISLFLNTQLLFMNAEFIIAFSLCVFFIIINNNVKNILVSFLFSRNMLIFESFVNVFYYNIILTDTILETFDFFNPLPYDSFNYAFNNLLNAFNIAFIISYRDNINRLIDLLQKTLVSLKLIVAKINSIKNTKIYFINFSLLQLVKNMDRNYINLKNKLKLLC